MSTVGFLPADARRIAESVKHHERSYRGNGPGRARWQGTPWPARLAVATSAFAAATVASGEVTYKPGTIAFYDDDGTKLTPQADNQDATNLMASAIAAGDRLIVLWETGTWRVIGRYC